MIEGYLYTEWHLVRHEIHGNLPETEEVIGSYLTEKEANQNFHEAIKDYIDDVMLGREVPTCWFEVEAENHS